jgi:hypothetical protein
MVGGFLCVVGCVISYNADLVDDVGAERVPRESRKRGPDNESNEQISAHFEKKIIRECSSLFKLFKCMRIMRPASLNLEEKRAQWIEP